MQLQSPFMQHAVKVAAMLLHDQAIQRIESYGSVIRIVSWSFVGVFVAFLALFYFPEVAKLTGPLHSARYILMLLPQELVQVLPDLQATLRDVATEAQLLSKTGVTASRTQSKGPRPSGNT